MGDKGSRKCYDREAMSTDVMRRRIPVRSHEQLERDCHWQNLKLVVADSTTLLVDCDSSDSFETVKENIQWVQSLLGIQKAWFTRSKSNNWHVYIKLGFEMSQRERVLLQAAIGGDFRRAMLDYRRTELAENPCEASVRQVLASGKYGEVKQGETVLFEMQNAEELPIELGPDQYSDY